MSTANMRVIIFKEEDCWVAQGLEHDICAQAASLNELYQHFELTVHLESNEDGGLERIRKAPKRFFDKWNERTEEATPTPDSAETYKYRIAA